MKLKHIMAVLVAGLFCAGMVAGETAPSAPGYHQWLARYARTNLAGPLGMSGTNQLKLVIVTVQGDDKTKSDAAHPRWGSGVLISETELSMDGHVSSFFESDFGSRGGGGGPPIPAEDLKRLDGLLAKLPGDGERLPPGGRRMLVEADVGGQLVMRVYDRANTPDAVWEIVRLGRGHVGSWVPEFKPQSEMDARPFEHGGFFRLSPGGREMLFSCWNGPLQIWDSTTHEFLADVPVRGEIGDAAAFSPDGSVLVVGGAYCTCLDTRTWKVIRQFQDRRNGDGNYTLCDPQFTPDGRYLFLQCNRESLGIYDTRTWQQLDRLPQVPEGAVQYFLSPRGREAVARLKSGAVVLWDVTHGRCVAELATNAYIWRVAFTANCSLVALATAQTREFLAFYGGPRLGIWKTENGERLHELKPYEQSRYESVAGLAWSPDEKYLLAVIDNNVSVFNTKTGRHRGQFTQPTGRPIGLALSADGSQLITGSDDGRIRFWDLKTGLKNIKTFEALLPPLPKP